MIDRRNFLAASFAASLTSSLQAQTARRPRIVLRSSWQTVNIGDIAHTPGVLHLLEKHVPQAEVSLWPSKVDNGVESLLQRHFPKLTILKDDSAVERAFRECDFLLHGSGPALVAASDTARWREQTKKPYGVLGITLSSVTDASRATLSGAQFVYFRDSVSLQLAKTNGVTCPVMEFFPDGAFAADLRDDPAAEAFLAANHLETGKFLCCIPRLRYTPYWRIHANRPKDATKQARNDEMQEHDHAPLREAIIEVVRQTSHKVLICPEDQTQMVVGKELLFDQLPDDVKQRVVWRQDYWLTGEALSTYLRSAGLFGLEMHSPILCIGHGIPAIVCRFREQTSKGLMWRDIGLSDWLFDMDQPADVARIVPTVLSLVQRPEIAKQKAQQAQAVVQARQRAVVERLGREWLQT